MDRQRPDGLIFDMTSSSWRRSQEAYEAYRAKPSTARLFDVFNECLESGWQEVTSNASSSPLGALFSRFEVASGTGDQSEALRIASHALEKAKGS